MRQGKQVFDGRLLKLFVEKRKLPNGNTVTMEVIRHPGAVLVVPFLSKDKIILIRQYRPVINSYIWEFPAGTFHEGESALRCAGRELVEEIGYEAASLKSIGYIFPVPGYATEKIIIYEARRLKKVKFKREPDEVIRAKALTRKEIAGLLESGRIVDAKTICALTLAKMNPSKRR